MAFALIEAQKTPKKFSSRKERKDREGPANAAGISKFRDIADGGREAGNRSFASGMTSLRPLRPLRENKAKPWPG